MIILDILRPYVVKFWPWYYQWKHKIMRTEFVTQKITECWWLVKKQGLLTQLFLLCLAIFATLAAVSKIYAKFTKVSCKSRVKLDGKTALITGANSGIGFETAKDLARRGARVILGVRNMQKGVQAAKKIVESTGNTNLVVRKLDLASISEVRSFAKEINESEPRLDILVLNAGIAVTKKYMTEDNLELHMASNHFGHFLLTNLLLPLLCETSLMPDRKCTDPVRIVVVSSIAHWFGKIELDNLNSEKSFASSRIYGNTKLANVLFANELARKLANEGFKNVTVNSVHPGPVQTNLFRNIPYYGWIIRWLVGLIYYTPEEGAQTSIYCSVSEEVAHMTGKYFSGCKVTKSSPASMDRDVARGLWEKSAQIVDLLPHETVVWN